MLRYFSRRRKTEGEQPVYDGDSVRAGGGPLDNLVVLIASLAILVVVGIVLVGYFFYKTPNFS